MARGSTWTGIALAAAWLAAPGCAGSPDARRPAPGPAEAETARRSVESILALRDWQEAAAGDPRPLSEQVNDLLRTGDGVLAAVLLEAAAIETEREEGKRQSILNLARFLAEGHLAPRTELRGPCVREWCGVAFWDEMPVPEEFLDPYMTLPTPGVLPEPPLWRTLGEFRREPLVPHPRRLLEGLMAEDGAALVYLCRGRGDGVGLELGLLARKDAELKDALLAAARGSPRYGTRRVALAVALAVARVREAEPVLLRWTEEVLEADDVTDLDQQALNQAYSLLLESVGPYDPKAGR